MQVIQQIVPSVGAVIRCQAELLVLSYNLTSLSSDEYSVQLVRDHKGYDADYASRVFCYGHCDRGVPHFFC